MRMWLSERLAPILGAAWCFRAGEQLYSGGEHLRGARLLARAARRGHVGAQLRIGQIYLSGQGMPPSRAEAARWLRRAAEAGSAEAQHAYAAFLWSPPNASPAWDVFAAAERSEGNDPDGALLWAARAAEAGLPEAQSLLGQILCFGPVAIRDEARGEASFQHAAAKGRPEASLGLALLLHRHTGDDPAHAADLRRLLSRAAEGGSAHAVFSLGVLAERTARDEEGWRAAANFYEEAAGLGHRAGQARFGMLQTEGIGTTQNPIEGESWVRKAALAGDREASFWLAERYVAQQGSLPPHPLEAAAWYRRAMDAGHGAAAKRLGALYRDGTLSQDLREAASLFARAAQLGEIDALADLHALTLGGAVSAKTMAEAIDTLPAGQYWYGRRLLENAATQEEARYWIARAAESQHVAAQAVLAEMMLHGRGGVRDVTAAVLLFERAAAAGHLGATFALGVLYAGAEGVPRDVEKAETMLRRAAAQGHAPAQTELEKFIAAGLLTRN